MVGYEQSAMLMNDELQRTHVSGYEAPLLFHFLWQPFAQFDKLKKEILCKRRT